MSKVEEIAGRRHRPSHAKQGAEQKIGRAEDRLQTLLAALEVQKQEVEERNRSLERSRAELAKTAEHYADLFDNAPLGYVSLDPKGVIVEANLTAADVLGRERERLVGHPLLGWVIPEDRSRFLSHMRRCRQEGGAVSEVTLSPEAGGETLEIESRRSKGREDSALYRTALIGLRTRRRSEAARVQADAERRQADDRERAMRAASEAKDLFIAELSHELRTPLTPILAAVTGLQERGELPAFLLPVIDMIRRNVEIEARLIDDLLDLSRIDQRRLHLEIGVIDAHAILADVAADLESESRSRGVDVAFELRARDSHVCADPLRLRQIFWNLLSNAIRNTPGGGHVSIASSNIGRELRVMFRDDGVGIEPARLEEIFAPFSREDRAAPGTNGLGLGLAIVRALVEAHGGKVAALSAGKGQGATFVVDLRTAEAVNVDVPSATGAVAPTTSRPPAKRPKRVLLVEDHEDTRAALQVFLELKGYEVTIAGDVSSAVELARQEPDVMVCDIGLPDGSGFDVMRRISSERPLQAIALTGYGTPRDIELAAQAGFAMHMTKPIAADRLLEAIEALSAAPDRVTER